MSAKYARRIRQYLDDLHDERDDLFKNVTRLINIADQQVHKILESEVVAEKETLQTFLRKILLVFSEVNNSVVKTLEACPFRENLPAIVEDQTQTDTDADLKDYLKENYTARESGIIASAGPKLSNTQVLNDSYMRKPLNDTTLKVICSTILNNSQITQKHEEIPKDNGSEVACMNTNEMEIESTEQMNIATNPCLGSPISSQTAEYASAASEAHPLMKVNPPAKIPKKYDTRDMDQIKENMMYFSRKMGFHSEDFFSSANQFDKSYAVSHYQDPSDILVPTDRPSRINHEQVRADNRNDANNMPQSENPTHLNNGATIQIDSLPNPENSVGPSASTGAIRKPMSTQRHPVDIPEARTKSEGPKMEVPTVDEKCVFTHIISPSEFYIQTLTDIHNLQLDLISCALFDKYNGSKCRFSSKQNALAKLGKFCCGICCDSPHDWFRFKVLDWKMDSTCDEVEVQSLDYGFKRTLSYTNLRELPSKVARIPALAVKCHFPFLYPAGSTYSHRLTEWPSEVMQALFEIANISRNPTETLNPTIFVIVFSHLDNDSFAVDLGYFNELTDVTLGTLLIDMELAKEIIDDYADYEELGEFLDDIDELEQAENLNEFIWGFDAKDEKRICRFTRNDGSCYKGKNCKLEHIMLKDGYTTDKSAIFYTAINDPEFPKKFETVVVSVTLYIDSCSYIVQVIKNPIKLNDTHIVMDRSVSELMNVINHPKKISKFEHFKGYPSKGEIILAMHPTAKKWMRVRVNAVKNNFREVSMEVCSVDFGDHFLVNIKNTRVMQEQFMHLPFQTFQIYLDNYQHRAGCDDSKAKEFFNRHIGYRTFKAHIKNAMPPFKVSLTTFKDCEIGPTLVKEGFAEERTIALDICEDEIKRGHFDAE
uniref:C3H1-type domain-containing protein n=1 Tax=Dendroctonus ponderosae TaxID=77166 RepID=A0AAR5PSV2_DENPD